MLVPMAMSGWIIGNVVTISEPWALVVVRMTAGTWAVDDMMLPLASVDVTTTFAEAVAAAVRRLVDKTTWPCGLVEEATMGMIAAVPVEVVVIPCAFVFMIAVGRNAIGETG